VSNKTSCSVPTSPTAATLSIGAGVAIYAMTTDHVSIIAARVSSKSGGVNGACSTLSESSGVICDAGDSWEIEKLQVRIQT
jgi:predicted sugar kinase